MERESGKEKMKNYGDQTRQSKRRLSSFEADIFAGLENLIRSVVHKEAKIQVDSYIRSSLPGLRDMIGKEAGSRTLKVKLFFLNEINPTVFTNNNILAKERKLLAVAICDTTNYNFDAIIETGHLSSALVEIVVLNGEFGSGQQGEEIFWSVSEFNNNIVYHKNEKRPLIVGTTTFCLEKGVGYIKNLCFTDSSWTRNRNFRLGARVVDEKFSGIGEAVSKPFRLIDSHGEVYKKHHPPQKEDQIWRLEGIGKDDVYDKSLFAKHIKTILEKGSKTTRENIVSDLECHVSQAPLALARNEVIGSEAVNMKWKVDKHKKLDDIEEFLLTNDHESDGEVHLSYSQILGLSLSNQNLMAQNLEVSEQKSFKDGHGEISADEFGGQIQGPTSYHPSSKQISWVENSEAMGQGLALEGIVEQDYCSHIFGTPPLESRGEASTSYNHNHEGENASTPKQYNFKDDFG